MRNKIAKLIRKYNRMQYPITPTETLADYKRDIRKLSKENKKLLTVGLIRRSQPKSIISKRQQRLLKRNINHRKGIPTKLTELGGHTRLMKQLQGI